MKKRVLQLCAVDFTVAKLLKPLIQSLEDDYEVVTVCSRGELSQSLIEQGIELHHIEIDRKINPIKNIRTIIHLYKYFKDNQFDIVHVHTPVAAILGRIAAKIARVPIVIYTAHGFYFHDNMPRLKKKFYVLVERIGGKLCDHIFTQSYEDYLAAIANGIIDQDKLLCIGNGVDLQRFQISDIVNRVDRAKFRQSLNIPPAALVIGMIGRIVKEKGYLEYLEAARKIIAERDNVYFLAIGKELESDYDGINEYIDKIKKDRKLSNRIIFTGLRDDVPELLSIMDIFTLPSYREGLPRSIIEAMAMQLPVIATNIRGCREEVIHGETGFLVEPQNAEQLYEKLNVLLDNSEMRKKMGEKARVVAEEQFNEENVIQKQKKVFSELLKRKGLI